MDKSFNSVPFWKVICGSILDLLERLLISPLMLLIFLLVCAVGVFWGIKIAIIAIANIFKSDSRVSENGYYAITIPNGWKAEQITEWNPLLSIVQLRKHSNKQHVCKQHVCFYTLNYNTTGISWESLPAMIPGGFGQINTQDREVKDREVKDIEFQDCKAVRVDGRTLDGIQTKELIFLSPSEKLSYIFGYNLNDQEFESLLSGVHLKNNQSPYADFDAFWKSFNEGLLEDFYQEIEDGLYLERWEYDKTNDVVSTNILFETDAITIQDFFKNSENKDYFTSEICRYSEVMIKVANNYNKTLLITIKDANGKPILSLPIDPNDLDSSQE